MTATLRRPARSRPSTTTTATVDPILLSQAQVTEVEERYVLDALRSGWIAPMGPHVDAFESEIARRVGVTGALALNSGTAALHLALLAVGAGPGTVVIVPTLTFAASANAVVYTGAEPVFVDCQLDDGNIDPELLLRAVDALQAEGVTVAAVMTVDLFGRCADYNAIETALEERGVPVVEDAAESLGAAYHGRPAGSFGKVAALSFNGNKIMTTSGGGMLLSSDADLVHRCRYLATQARQLAPWYEHTEVGYNYGMSNVLAALGRGQLTRLNEMLARRRRIRRRYQLAFAEVPGIRLLADECERDAGQDNAWLTVLILDRGLGRQPHHVVTALGSQQIETRHVWKPMHLQPAFRDRRTFISGAAERLFRTGVVLPGGAGLRDADIDRVITHVIDAVS